ncbi:hypothetical protein RhiirC2_781399 [Rhizophagus irregularis]|uniref:Uncharacterized protein n=1 Tax=Rhizophagus irregularis TaxID=588596 RepID=A0A2N1N5E5_9GLOM|nr:hypothetical protein RhiirC2_781399 [Rhizophagus irregularis]
MEDIVTFPYIGHKAIKVKFFVEELSTIEQMEKSLNDLYDGWLYILLDLKNKHFHMFGLV